MAKSFLTTEEIEKLEQQEASSNPLEVPSGKKFLTTEEINQLEQEEQDFSNRPFAAAGAAAASVLSFGGSDYALTKTGLVKPETLAGLREHNEGVTIGAELAALAAGLLVPGAGLLGAGKAVKTIAKVGEKVSAKTAAKLGVNATNPTTQKILKKALAAGAGSAVEGAFYGGGRVISENALGTGPENAQAILADVSMAALLGGGLGFLFKGAGESVPIAYRKLANATIPKLQQNIDKARDKYVDISTFVTNGDKAYLTKLFSNTPEGKVARENQTNFLTRREELAREWTADLKNQESSLKKYVKEYYEKVRPEELLNLNNTTLIGNAVKATKDLLGKNHQLLDTMKFDAVTFPVHKVTKIEKELNKFINESKIRKTLIRGKEGPRKLYENIEEYKRRLDKHIDYEKKTNPLQKEFQNELINLRGNVKELLEDAAVWGEPAARQAVMNNAYNSIMTFRKPFMQEFGKKKLLTTGKEVMKINSKRVHAFVTKMHKQGGDEQREVVDNYINALKDFANKSTLTNDVELAEAAAASLTAKGLPRTRANIEEEIKDLNKFTQMNWYNERSKGSDAIAGAIGGAAKSLGLAGLVSGVVGAPLYAAGVLGQTAASSIYGLAKDPAKAMRIMHFIETAKFETTKKIGKNIKAFLMDEKTQTVGKVAKLGLISNMSSTEKKREQWEKNSTKYSQLSQDPQMFQQEIADKLGPLAEVAPETAAALSANMAEALQMLSGAIPKMDDDNFLGFRPEIPPSDYEISEFANMERLIQSPLTLLDDLNNGMITIQNAAIVKSLYPEIYNQIIESVMQEVIDSKVKLSYQKRMDLSVLLGRPLDSSMTPQFIQSMQQMHSPQTQQVMQQAGANNAEFSGAQFAKSKGSKNAQTPLQSSLGQ